MKRNKLLSMILVAVMILPLIVACGDGGGETSNDSSSLTSANLTADGYYDGLLYYKITTTSPNEVAISKANKNIQTVKIPPSERHKGQVLDS